MSSARRTLPPVVRLLIPCRDCRITPGYSGQLHIIGYTPWIVPSQLPMLYEQICLVSVLTDCRGAGEIVIRLEHADTLETIVEEAPTLVELPTDPLRVSVRVHWFKNLLFTEPGLYEFALHFNGRRIGDAPLEIREPKGE